MSKVLHMLDFRDLLTWEHDEWIQIQMEKIENENITDDDKFESYVNPDGDFTSDDIPF
jgi:hypothetical protein